uniref:DUF4373 domain-containing protein n=1 Tax=Strongyloides venezuelensis TaxID=75913 RepID=A0A0K0F2Y8_STRVS
MPNTYRVLYMVLGKIELTRKESDLLDTFYICQWDDRFGQVTVQSFESLSGYLKDIGTFEGKSTFNQLIGGKNDQPNDSRISNEQINFLKSALKQYKKAPGAPHEWIPSPDSDIKSLRTSMERIPSSEMNIETISISDDSDKKFSETISIKSTSSENSKPISLTVPNGYSLDHSNGKKMVCGDSDQVECNIREETTALMNTPSVFPGDFDNKSYCKPLDTEKKANENRNNGNVVLSSIESYDDSNESQIVTDSEDSILDTKCFSMKHPRYWSDDFTSAIGIPFSDDGYNRWKSKWAKAIKQDMKNSKSELDWTNLEIISETNIDNTSKLICYDTTTHLMSTIEYHQVPESQKYKIHQLKKVSGLGNVVRSKKRDV